MVNTSSRSSDDAAMQVISVAERLGREISPRLENGVSISHPGSGSIARKVIQLMTGQHPVRSFEGKAASLVGQVRDTHPTERVDASVINFALHNCNETQIQELLQHVQCTTNDGVVLILDYTLKGFSRDDAEILVRSKIEEKRILEYHGFAPWLEAHNKFSLDDLYAHAHDSGFRYISASPLHAGRGMVLASNSHNLDAEALVQNAEIVVRKPAMETPALVG